MGLRSKQLTLLRKTVMEAYEARGITKDNPDTWGEAVPTLNDVYNLYFAKNDIKEDSLYAAISNLADFEIFEPETSKTKPLFDIIDGVTVINMTGYEENLQNLVVAITLDVFYNQMLNSGASKIVGDHRQLTKMILVDEADNFLSKDFKSFKKILKEGRMFGVGAILSTQLLSHFSTPDNEYSKYVLTWIVHNVSDLNSKDVRFIFNTQTKVEEENISNRIKSLTKHQSLVKLPDIEIPIAMKDKAFWELVSE